MNSTTWILLIEGTILSFPQVTTGSDILFFNSNANCFHFAIESDPFYELQESHSLIGVANIYMDVLFHDVKLNYYVPIISQQGEVAGKLQV